ncbi:MAG TPA: 3-deoxy-manno-octulosonate cytidylyltransferase [Dissulfurispiraceae bacterium]
MPAIVIIPSRFASTRFPGKPLCPLFGKPIIQHVYEKARGARLIQGTFVATDDRRIFDAVVGFGGKAIMTSSDHQSGTDRIAEAVMHLDAEEFKLGNSDVVVNVQGDEPMIHPSMVDAVVELMEDPRASIGTLSKRIEHEEDAADPNVVKVVSNGDGFALYFSRAPIPYHRGGDSKPRQFYKHIGIYAYRKEALLAFSKLLPTGLEGIEKLEQLRALEHGFKIKVKETPFDTIGVDTPRDLERVEKCLSLSS